MRRAEVVPDQLDAMDALDHLRRAEVPMLLVHDEYGHFEGIVTPADLLSAIAGEFASDQDMGRNLPSFSGTMAACSFPARCQPTRWRNGSASICLKIAIMRQWPVMRFGFSSICPRWASIFTIRAGASKSSIWTVARSTSCWSAKNNA